MFLLGVYDITVELIKMWSSHCTLYPPVLTLSPSTHFNSPVLTLSPGTHFIPRYSLYPPVYLYVEENEKKDWKDAGEGQLAPVHVEPEQFM